MLPVTMIMDASARVAPSLPEVAALDNRQLGG